MATKDGWVYGNSNTKPANQTSKPAAPADGFVYGKSASSGIQPEGRSFLEKLNDARIRASVEGVGGTIAYPVLRARGHSEEEINQARIDVIAGLDAKDQEEALYDTDTSVLHRIGNAIPGLIGGGLGTPEAMIGGGGLGVARQVARASLTAGGIDAANQGIQLAEGYRDDPNIQQTANTVGMTAGFGLVGHGLLGATRKVLGLKGETGTPGVNAPASSITPEQLAAVDDFIKTNPNFTADDLRARGIGNADEVVAARDKGQGVSQAVDGTAPNETPGSPAANPVDPVAPAEAFEPDIVVQAGPKPAAQKPAYDPEAFVDPGFSPNGKLVHEITSDTPKNKSVYAHYTAEPGKDPVKFGVLINKETGEATININVDKIDSSPEHAGDYGDKAIREGLKDVLREYPEIASIGGIRKRGAKGLKDTEQKIPAAVVSRIRKQIAKEDAVKPLPAPIEEAPAAKGPTLADEGVVPQPNPRPAEGVEPVEREKYLKSINAERLDLTDETYATLEAHTKSLGLSHESHAETLGKAQSLLKDKTIDEILTADPALSQAPQYGVASRVILEDSLNKQVTLARDVNDPSLTTPEKEAALALMTVRTAAAAEKVNKEGLLAGRTLSSRRVRAIAGDLSGNKGLRNLGSALPAHVNAQDLAKVILEHADSPETLARIAADSMKKTLWDKFIGFRYNMMLFGPSTHVANNMGIFSTVTSDLLAQTLASVSGQVGRSADRVAAREIAARVEGMMAGLFAGARYAESRAAGLGRISSVIEMSPAASNARRALNEGDILTPEGRSEHTVSEAGASAIGDLTALGSRTLNAEDEFWRTIIHTGSNHALAYRAALKEGRKGQAFRARVQGLINSPTKEMAEASNEYAHRMLLRDAPTPITAGFMRWRNIKTNDDPVIKALKGSTQIVFPFVRVLDRAAMWTVRHSPIAALDRVTQADFKAGGARAEIAKARIATGTALATWAALKAFNNELTGPGPEDFEANQKWQAAGHRPNSIVVDGQYRDISNLLPLVIPMTAIAAAVEESKTGKYSEKTYADKVESLVADMVQAMGTNTWTAALSDLGKMVTGSRGQKAAARKGYVANVAASFVPAFLRQANQANPLDMGDASVRATSGDGSLVERVVGRVASAVPGASEMLPQKYNVYGKPVMREGVYGPAFLSNVKVSDLDTDPAVQEMDRLMAANDYKSGVSPVDSSLQVPDYAGGGPNRKLTAAEVQEYQRVAGTYITDYVRQQINTPEWKRMSDDERRDDLTDTVEKAKKQARDELFWNPTPKFEYGTAQQGQAETAAAAVESLGARVTSKTRTLEEQQYLYDHYRGVARPGTSEHEKDRAIDIVPTRGLTPAKIKQDLVGMGYNGVTVNTKKHGSGAHWHVQWADKTDWVYQ